MSKRLIKWRIFKDRSGCWWAVNRSIVDGFRYEQRGFESHAEAVEYIIANPT